ncbi:unnamed protein product [Haemonchus placei]|uniref:Fibronectin type-III domain-containing protein n=1 Tax=Haemonchus placei TaxID=6290 RepID=A0A0N4VZN1_HAEPC|nr:unnamed protein product [Haemonchus placei]
MVEIESKIGKPVIAVTEHTYHTALNMSPGIPYRFRVRVNVDGWGVWSDPLWYELGRGIVQQHQGPETTPLGAVPGWVVLMTMILFVLLLAFLVVLCRRKRHNRKQMSDLDVLDTYKQGRFHNYGEWLMYSLVTGYEACCVAFLGFFKEGFRDERKSKSF